MLWWNLDQDWVLDVLSLWLHCNVELSWWPTPASCFGVIFVTCRNVFEGGDDSHGPKDVFYKCRCILWESLRLNRTGYRTAWLRSDKSKKYWWTKKKKVKNQFEWWGKCWNFSQMFLRCGRPAWHGILRDPDQKWAPPVIVHPINDNLSIEESCRCREEI